MELQDARTHISDSLDGPQHTIERTGAGDAGIALANLATTQEITNEITDPRRRDSVLLYYRYMSVTLSWLMLMAMFGVDGYCQLHAIKYACPDWAVAVVLGSLLGGTTSQVQYWIEWILDRAKRKAAK